MKPKMIIVALLAFFFSGIQMSQAAAVRVGPASTVPSEELRGSKDIQKDVHSFQDRKGRKLEKKVKRLERKMKKRGWSPEQETQDFWSDSKFKLGILLLIVAVGLAIVGLIISLGGLFSFMAGLFAIAGVVLVVWSALENYG